MQGCAVAGYAVFVPGAVRGQHEVVGAERHLVAVDDGIGALAFHDEAKRGCRMGVGGRDLARMHDLQTGIEPADRGGMLTPAGIVQIDDAAAGLLGRHQFDGAQHMSAEVLVAPQDRNGRRFGRPRLDLVRNRPERARLQSFEFVVIGEQFGRILDIGPSGHVFAVVFTSLRRHVALRVLVPPCQIIWSGITAIAWISTLARSSISPDTCSAVMAGKCRPMTSR